jgi:hypothetical protein
MLSLLIPQKVVLRLVDSTGIPVRVANVLFRVHAFANRKNDFSLGPFATDVEGVATITKRDMLAEATAHYDSGLMDYDRIENCQPVVEIAAMGPSDIDKALRARTSVWKRCCKERLNGGQASSNSGMSTATLTDAFRSSLLGCAGTILKRKPSTTFLPSFGSWRNIAITLIDTSLTSRPNLNECYRLVSPIIVESAIDSA